MSKKYYVNKKAQANGDHEVHTHDCVYRPQPANVLDLGIHSHCRTAVTEAKKHFSQVNGCKYCSGDCHTQ